MIYKLQLVSLLFSIFLVQCNIDDEKQINNSKKCTEIKNYYNNGNLKEAGMICNEKRSSYWKEFYEDGSLLWSGHYYNGTRQYDTTKIYLNKCSIEILENNKLHLNKENKINVKINGVHPDDIFIGINNGDAKISKSKEHNFILVPNSFNKIKIYVYIQLYADPKLIYDTTFDVVE